MIVRFVDIFGVVDHHCLSIFSQLRKLKALTIVVIISSTLQYINRLANVGKYYLRLREKNTSFNFDYII